MVILFVLLAILLLIAVFILFCAIRSFFIIIKAPIENIYKSRKLSGNFCNYYDLPYKTIDFLLAFEDSHFFEHKGYDLNAIKNAFWFNIRTKQIKHGGSTITQQLVKNLYFKFDHSFVRKLCELFVSIHIERKLTKIQIIELYLNIIYFGNEIYGLYDASKYYFDKNYKELTVNQIFLLLSFLSAPTTGNPYNNPDIFISLRNKKVKQVLWIGADKEYPKEIINYNENNLDPELIKRPISKTEIKMKNEKYGIL